MTVPAVPAPLVGHLIPLLPLENALRDAGHDVLHENNLRDGPELVAAPADRPRIVVSRSTIAGPPVGHPTAPRDRRRRADAAGHRPGAAGGGGRGAGGDGAMPEPSSPVAGLEQLVR